jgi:hypothetical protein
MGGNVSPHAHANVTARGILVDITYMLLKREYVSGYM